MDPKDWNPKDWIVVLLTVVFVALYVLAVFGVVKATDDKLVVQIAPIISVIIGYYFGRIPGEKNEKTLQAQVNATRGERDQVANQRDQAHNERNNAVQESTKFQTKIADARAALSAAAPTAPLDGLAASLSGDAGAAEPEAVRRTAAAALKILESA